MVAWLDSQVIGRVEVHKLVNIKLDSGCVFLCGNGVAKAGKMLNDAAFAVHAAMAMELAVVSSIADAASNSAAFTCWNCSRPMAR